MPSSCCAPRCNVDPSHLSCAICWAAPCSTRAVGTRRSSSARQATEATSTRGLGSEGRRLPKALRSHGDQGLSLRFAPFSLLKVASKVQHLESMAFGDHLDKLLLRLKVDVQRLHEREVAEMSPRVSARLSGGCE